MARKPEEILRAIEGLPQDSLKQVKTFIDSLKKYKQSPTAGRNGELLAKKQLCAIKKWAGREGNTTRFCIGTRGDLCRYRGVVRRGGKNDPDHSAAMRWLSANREPLVTTDYVLAETATLIRMRDKLASS